MAFSEIWVEILLIARYVYTIAATANTFICTATANIDDDAAIDSWTIDQTCNLLNPINDVTTI